jgi:hypothetical protein
MDGVIADFYKRYFERYKLAPRDAEKKKEFNKYFDEFIATGQFATLDLMPGTMEGLEFLRNAPVPTEILSSTANEARYDAISKQKIDWLQKHGITFKPNLVPGKRHKWKFAAPDKIIIDDTPSVIEDWRNAGGIGILHKDWPETLAILSNYV